jgi:hypothetical protein
VPVIVAAPAPHLGDAGMPQVRPFGPDVFS